MKKLLLLVLFVFSVTVKCFSQLNCVEPSYINSSFNCGSITDSVCGCNGVSYANSCEAFYHHGVTVWTSGSCNNPPACHADFTYILSNGSYYFNSTSSSGTINWAWDFGDGLGYAGTSSAFYAYPTSGTYIVCLTTTNSSGCESTTCKVIEAVAQNQNCSALFGYSDSCGAVHFIDFSSGNNLTYNWDFGDGTYGSGYNPYHSYSTSGWITVCLTITDTVTACTSQNCQSCFVHVATGVASFTYTNPIVYQVAFDGSFSGIATNWYWTFGDGNSANIEDTAYTYSGCVNTACLQVADDFGCLSAPVCQTLNACSANPCYVNFTHADSCSTIHFTSQSLSANCSYSWNFGDGNFSVLPNPIHTYASSGNYNVCLIATDTILNCVDTACQTVTPHVMIGTPVFSANNISYSPNVVEFNGSFSDSTTEWLWNFGDGQTASTIDSTTQHTFSNCIYTTCVQVHDQFNCYSPIYCDTIIACELIHSCTADFSFNDSCGEVQFTNLSTSLSNLTYQWNFGDFNIDSVLNPMHEYAVSSNFNVCLTVTDSVNQCINTYCDTIPVHVPDFSANFSALQTNHNPNIAQFYDQTLTPTGTILTNWIWNFGDGTSIVSGIQNPIHTFIGCDFLVCLTTLDSFGCSSVFCDSVHLCDDGINSLINNFQFFTYFNGADQSIQIILTDNNATEISVELYDLYGKKINAITVSPITEVQKIISIPAATLSSSIYFLRIKSTENSIVGKVEVLK